MTRNVPHKQKKIKYTNEVVSIHHSHVCPVSSAVMMMHLYTAYNAQHSQVRIVHISGCLPINATIS